MPVLKKRKGEKKSQQFVRSAMTEKNAGKLHSGSKTGPVVKDRKQAVAIGLSEARKASGGRKPPPKKKRPTKKSSDAMMMLKKRRGKRDDVPDVD